MPTRAQLHASWKFQMNFLGVFAKKQFSIEPQEEFSGKEIGTIAHDSKEKKLEIIPNDQKKEGD